MALSFALTRVAFPQSGPVGNAEAVEGGSSDGVPPIAPVVRWKSPQGTFSLAFPNGWGVSGDAGCSAPLDPA
jgi:hypothetical protein